MPLLVNIRSYFTPTAIAQQLEHLPPLKTTVMDTVFTTRLRHELPIVGVDEIFAVTKVLPVVRRGAAGTPLFSDNLNISYIEPMPIKISTTLGGVELNNLKLLTKVRMEEWARRKMDEIRRATRRTTEVLSAQAIRGKISHAMKTDGGGTAVYQVDYGSPCFFTPGVKWDDGEAKAKDIYETLLGMRKLIHDGGWAGTAKIWAGTKAYLALLNLLDTATPADKIGLRLADSGGIMVGGEFKIELFDDSFINPASGQAENIVDTDQVVMIILDAGHRLFYAALDDLDSNLQPLPLFIKPSRSEDGTIKLFSESKPLPAPNIKAICWATVTTS
ncbi:MAG: major capsid protein [Desulfarculales bacterium]|jgi:hypothetical protein|nr:major capsid protein [Desulfarculales bacterium]